ncbi:MAG: hypothetical protein QE276_00160 [Cyanobium sp. D14.bin.5]|nr:hypothetical protein [Cyanobium sp. D14.bin.5]
MYWPTRRGDLAPTSESCRNENLGRLQPKTLKPAEPSRPKALHPTNCPFAGSNLGSQPGAGAASGAPEGEAQGIPKQLAVLARAGGRQIGRANANALAAKGNAGKDWWRNQWARAMIWVAVSKPSELLGVFWGGVELVLGLAAA